MSDDRDHTISTATVTSEETPYGVRINTEGHALRGDEPVDRGGGDSGPAPFGLLLSGSVPAPRSRCECTPNIGAGRWHAWMSS